MTDHAAVARTLRGLGWCVIVAVVPFGIVPAAVAAVPLLVRLGGLLDDRVARGCLRVAAVAAGLTAPAVVAAIAFDHDGGAWWGAALTASLAISLYAIGMASWVRLRSPKLARNFRASVGAWWAGAGLAMVLVVPGAIVLFGAYVLLAASHGIVRSTMQAQATDDPVGYGIPV